jgi:hypothetical protein
MIGRTQQKGRSSETTAPFVPAMFDREFDVRR